MKNDKSEMTAVDVIEIVKLLEKNGITIIIDGGWGVDALLGEQTRNHEDLDVAVLHKDVPLIRSLLEARGYQNIPRDDTWECNFVLGDDQGHLFDLHSCTFDAAGNNVFGVEYLKDSWEGTGTINGYPVRCITPEWMVKFHAGYELDENDYHDVKLLCQRYALEIPSEYAAFDRKDGQS
jgi:lincosamide nucleotidyltransferase A/C/D/E